MVVPEHCARVVLHVCVGRKRKGRKVQGIDVAKGRALFSDRSMQRATEQAHPAVNVISMASTLVGSKARAGKSMMLCEV